MGTAQREQEYFKEGPGTGKWPGEGARFIRGTARGDGKIKGVWRPGDRAVNGRGVELGGARHGIG